MSRSFFVLSVFALFRHIYEPLYHCRVLVGEKCAFLLVQSFMLASGVPNHILSGITNHFLPENWEPINEFLDCQQPRLANCLFLCCHRLNSLNLASLH